MFERAALHCGIAHNSPHASCYRCAVLQEGLVRLIQDAQAQRSPTEMLVERFAKIYTPVVVLIAVGFATVPWAVTDAEKAEEWLYTSLVLLVTACPCALVISTPITYVCALALSAKKGILIKGGIFLEQLGRLSTICIDKTGTLTEGRFRLVGLATADEKAYPRAEVLRIVAGAERQANHPLATAIVNTALGEGVSPSSEVTGFEMIEGEGISATVEGSKIYVGNRRLAERLGWIGAGNDKEGGSTAAIDTEPARWEGQASTVLWYGTEASGLRAVLAVADKVRDEAAEAIRLLEGSGIRTVMLTGDNEGTADAVAKQTGVSQVESQLKPKDKVASIAKHKAVLVKGATIAMVGDGVNDAAALSIADVGIAMGAGGTAAAMESAHVALMDSSLLKLVLARELGLTCLRKIRQNVGFSIVSKLVVLGLAVAGHAPLWLAIMADVGSMLVVSINGLSILSEKGGGEAEAATAHAHGAHAHGHGYSPSSSGAHSHGHAHGGVPCDGSGHDGGSHGHGNGGGQGGGHGHGAHSGGHGHGGHAHGHGHGTSQP
eukprot:SAG11_NODE_2751_length_3010_cov_1.479560_2_plen_548_part_00